MAFDLSNASNAMKVRYIGPIRNQLNNATILMSRIAKDSSFIDVSGKTFTVPLHTGRNVSAGAGRADGGTLPTAGQQGYDVAVVPNAYTYATIKITGPTIAATRDNVGSFVRAVDSEVQGATRDFKRVFNRQLHGDGRDALAFWTTGDDTSGTNVDDGRGNAFVHLPTGTITADLIDASDHSTKLGDSIVVTLGAKGSGVYAITWTGTVSGSADGDYLVMEDTLGNQMMGLRGIADDGDPPLLSGGLHGLPVATKTFWTSQVFDNSATNRDLTLELMQQPLDAIDNNSDYTSADVEFLLSSTGVRAKYVSLLVAEKRFVNTMELDGGFKGVDFNGIPLVVDPQCVKNRIYYVVPEVLKIFRSQDFAWMEKDGAVLSRVSGQDAYEATLTHYGNLGCIARNALGLLDDISE